jgi:uncharacterized integral membrane protein (TIGR00698 family)
VIDLRGFAPGLAVSGVVGIAATFRSNTYLASAMVFALLLGMALNFLAEEGRCRRGIQLAATTVLRVGVVLLGLRITIELVSALGWMPMVTVIATVTLTVLAGIVLTRAFGQTPAFGTLTGGAVAICGASAALAIASILPRLADAERDAGFTVIAITALSTLAMITYPMVVTAFGFDDARAGAFLGGTTHDVAQVVGAGYSVSAQTGDTATIVKLLRVGMLLPVCVATGLLLHTRSGAVAHSAPILPCFAVAFAMLIGAGSMGLVPAAAAKAGSELSRVCLATAIASIGMKTSLKSLTTMGWRPVLLVVPETLFLAVMFLGALCATSHP